MPSENCACSATASMRSKPANLAEGFNRDSSPAPPAPQGFASFGDSPFSAGSQCSSALPSTMRQVSYQVVL